MVDVKGFKELVHEGARALSEMVVEENMTDNKLISRDQQRQKIEHEIETNALEVERKMHDGLEACLLALKECHDLKLSMEEVLEILTDKFKNLTKKEQFTQAGENLLNGQSFADQLKIPENCMETLYQGARALFEKKDNKKAALAFFALSAIDPSRPAHWIGLGHSSAQNNDIDQAIRAYAMASALDPENIWPHIWAADCFEKEKNFDDAKMALGEALKLQKEQAPQDQKMIRELEERFNNVARRS